MRWRLGVVVASCLSGAAWGQPTNAGGYMRFDGVNDAVSVRGEFAPEHLTVEAWVVPESLHPQFNAGIVTYGAADRASFNLGIGRPGDERPRFYINWNQSQKTLIGNTAVTMNAWQHIAVTYDGSVARLYINGALDARATFDADILPSGDRALLAIGDDYPGDSQFLGAQIDEVRIWSVARSESEIQDSMDAPLTGAEPGLLAYYDFDEADGQVALDGSPNGYHARLGLSFSPESRDPARLRYAPSRLRAMKLTSREEAEVIPIGGSISQQLAIINAGPPDTGWSPVLYRHNDLHQRDSFSCGQNYDKPYVDATQYLAGADELTYDNCGSAFYRVKFDMPPVFANPAVIGAANADDLGLAYVNKRPISLLLTDEDVDNLGRDRIHTRHHLLGWPTPDPIFEDRVPDIVRPGSNTFTVGVCSDASPDEPAGVEFRMVIQYECYADWNASGDNDTIDFTAFLNDWNARKPESDLNKDGTINSRDVLLFINVWAFGCPE